MQTMVYELIWTIFVRTCSTFARMPVRLMSLFISACKRMRRATCVAVFARIKPKKSAISATPIVSTIHASMFCMKGYTCRERMRMFLNLYHFSSSVAYGLLHTRNDEKKASETRLRLNMKYG